MYYFALIKRPFVEKAVPKYPLTTVCFQTRTPIQNKTMSVTQISRSLISKIQLHARVWIIYEHRPNLEQIETTILECKTC